MKTILVQLSARPWTMQALHLACALARNAEAEVVLLRLMQVRHPGYLGTEFGYASPTRQEQADLADYSATAEDYGISLALRQMQCVTALNAVADAAEQTGSEIVFAHVPPAASPAGAATRSGVWSAAWPPAAGSSSRWIGQSPAWNSRPRSRSSPRPSRRTNKAHARAAWVNGIIRARAGDGPASDSGLFHSRLATIEETYVSS
jgi:hypothetical protein